MLGENPGPNERLLPDKKRALAAETIILRSRHAQK